MANFAPAECRLCGDWERCALHRFFGTASRRFEWRDGDLGRVKSGGLANGGVTVWRPEDEALMIGEAV
jgi:hypothetical protein